MYLVNYTSIYIERDGGKTSDKKWQQRLLIIRSNFVNNNHHQLMKWNFLSKGIKSENHDDQYTIYEKTTLGGN